MKMKNNGSAVIEPPMVKRDQDVQDTFAKNFERRAFKDADKKDYDGPA
jgi:hypothetical protein